MKLYEIDQAILECIDAETGEILDADKLNSLEMARDQKISNVACWLKDLKAENEAIKAEKQNLTKRETSNSNLMERLKGWIDFALDGQKFKDGRVSISYRSSESVEVDENVVDNLPEEFVKVEKSPKKKELKEAIESGQTFDGVQIVSKKSVIVR